MNYDKYIFENIEKQKRNDIIPLFRTVAGVQLSRCGAVQCEYLGGLRFHGSDSSLTESFLLDVLSMLSTPVGEICPLGLKSSIQVAKWYGLTGEIVPDLKGIKFSGYIEESSVVPEGVGSVDTEAYGNEPDEMDELNDFDFDKEDPEDGLENVSEEKEQESTEKDSEDASTGDISKGEEADKDELKKKIEAYYAIFYEGIVDELIKRYTSLFESGYEVITPAGIITSEGLAHLSGSQKVYSVRTATMDIIYSLCKGYIGFKEVDVRSNKKIADIIYSEYMGGSRSLLYFPNKLLEFAYGRCCPKGDNADSVNTYEKHADSANWAGFSSGELKKNLTNVVKGSVTGFVFNQLGEDYDYSRQALREEVQRFLSYLQSCLSMCLLMVDFKTRKESIDSFKLRICDPTGKVGSMDLTPVIIKQAFMGSTGKVPFSYDPRYVPETFVSEFAHEFNHDVSQSMPLFAYKALDSLKNQGVPLNWDNLILGMGEDGTILRNGKGGSSGISLESSLTHFITAGSRAGKGVMTLNVLAGSIISKKNVFYLDRKPDMASIFKTLSPNMFVVNGGGYQEQYDNYRGVPQFSNLNSMLNVNNIPKEALEAFEVTSCNWSDLGDLFYLRALKLVLGIIVARAEGHGGDPNFGGSDGILLVVDEFKNFQDSLTILLRRLTGKKIPPATYKKNLIEYKKAQENPDKGAATIEAFEDSYSSRNYYSLSFLNSLAEDLRYLSEKTDAGFDQAEIAMSDIFIIGQDIKKGMININDFQAAISEGRDSQRYLSVGSSGLKSGKFMISEGSIPFNLLSFKNCDAFFGRNRDEGRAKYLAQTNKSSMAYGRLDDKASKFAYMRTFDENIRKRIVMGSESDNIYLANGCVYFKPFLILNEGDESAKCVKDMFDRCAYASPKEIREENPHDELGSRVVNPAIGFEEYLQRGGVSDYSEILERSSHVADYVVKNCLHYPGNWFDFITDLRPEWMFTIKDICDGAKGGQTLLSTPDKNPVLLEYVRAYPELFGVMSTDSEESEESEGVSSFIPDDDFSDFDRMSEDSDRRMGKELGDFDVIGDDEEIDLFSDGITDDFYNDDEDDWKVEEGTVTETGHGDALDDLLSGQDEEFKKILQQLDERGYKLVKDGKEVRSPESSKDEPLFSSIEKAPLEDDFSFYSEESDEKEEDSLSNLVEIVTKDIISKFGGLDRITTFRVVGGSFIINGYCYRCKLGKSAMRSLPYDLQRDINSGNLSKLFDYSRLRKMSKLRYLEFDSLDLVYDYVGYAFGSGSDISASTFFKRIKSLQVLVLQKKTYTAQNYQQLENEEDPFYKVKKSKDIEKSSDNILKRATKGSWGYAKRVARNKKYGKLMKALGVTAGVVGAGAAGAAYVSTGAGKKLLKGAKAFGSEVRDFFKG